MNKKLLALAVAAALAPAAAMADSGNVTVYGIMDASFDATDNGSTAAGVSGARANKVSSNSSRLGFKGTEDLGNGTSAIWQIETAINADGTAAANLNSRNTFVGLSSKSMGTALFGRHDTPYKLATRSLDYFGDGLADNRNLMGQGAASFDGRQSDVVAYITPTVNGLHAAIAYVAGAEATTTSNTTKGNAYSLMGMYANGPLMASLAYERHNMGTPGTGTVVGTAAMTNQDEHAWKLGVGYNFGALDVGFVYEKTGDNLAAGTELMGHRAYTLGAKYKMGSNDLKLAYTNANNQANTSNTGANQWALGLDHNMSKRTKVYVQYVRLNNEDAAVYGLNGAGASGSVNEAGRAGADPSAWSFGIRHSF